MEEGNKRNGNGEKPKNYEYFSNAVRAGRRTYFFDVKATQGNDFYITITESKRCISKEGHVNYQRHKIFLYPEDFDLYSNGLAQIIDFVRNTNPKTASIIKPLHTLQKHEIIENNKFNDFEIQEPVTESYTNLNVEFEDLDNTK